jgi:riboflavin transporter FmnP
MILEHLNFILKYMTFLLPNAPFFSIHLSLFPIISVFFWLQSVSGEIWDVCKSWSPKRCGTEGVGKGDRGSRW